MNINDWFQMQRPGFQVRFALEAEHELMRLMEWVLACAPLVLHAHPERNLNLEEEDRLNNAVHRRLLGEPLSRIVGQVTFLDASIRVSKHVLVPRHETEWWLHEWIRTHPLTPDFNGFANPLTPDPSPKGEGGIYRWFLDIGTGSGAIAIALCQAFPDIPMYASDISSAALQVAQENMHLNAVVGIEWAEADLWPDAWDQIFRESCGVMFANLPYVPSKVIPTLDPEVREHDPQLALDGGSDGLDIIRRGVERAESVLTSGSRMILEMGLGQSELLATWLRSRGRWEIAAIWPDLQGIPRAIEIERIA